MTDTTMIGEHDLLAQAAEAWDMQSLLPFYRTLLADGFALNDVLNRMRWWRELADRPIVRVGE